MTRRSRKRTQVAAEAPIETAAPSPLVLPGVVACFLLSGFAALLYQTAWLRQFSLVFGTSELAVAAVLAAYMGGLAAGAAVAGRYLSRVQRPILVYGLLEAGIAVSALAVPLLLAGARALYTMALGDQAAPPDATTFGQPMFYLVVAFIVLALPTGFMGATLPLLTRHAVTTDRQVGPRVALLYATNTAGAVFGTVVAAFLLLPALGLTATVWIGVAVNALVFLIAAMLAKRAPAQVEKDDRADSGDGESDRTGIGFFNNCIAPLLAGQQPAASRLCAVFHAQPGWILPLILVSGANAFFYEVLWTRMLTHVLGGSIYAFATMLAAFLTGIALGGGLAGNLATNRKRAAIAFAIAQVAIAVLSMLIYTWMGALIPDEITPQRVAVYAITIMLPATIFIGATFPLAVRILARNESEAGTGTARIYTWNTIGAIFGAILAGFYLIPGLGFEGSIQLAILINLVLALWTIAFVAPPNRIVIGAVTAVLVAAVVFYQPERPQAVITSTGFALGYEDDPQELYYSVGRSSTVMMLQDGGYFYVRTNGLPEASILASGGPPVQDPEKWLTSLPVVARPDTESMLVIGFGGGVALEGVPPSVQTIDAIELEPEVIAANRVLLGKRNRDPLEDPRINLIINDARNAMRLTNRNYDVIVSQPSHPWTAGASHLFTREFVADMKSHLNPDGVFVQWMNSEFVEEPLLRTLAATLLAEFSNVRLYQPSPQVLVFLSSEGALDLEVQLARTGQPFTDDIMHYSRIGLNSVEDLLAALMMDEEGVEEFAADSPVSTDDNNLMATDSRSRADGLYLNDLNRIFRPYDPMTRRGSWIYTRLIDELDFGYITRRLLQLGYNTRSTAIAQMHPRPASQLVMYGLIYAAAGQWDRAKSAYEAALTTDPENMQARFLLIRDYLAALGNGAASEEIVAIAADLSEPGAAVVEGWGHGASSNYSEIARLDAVLARTRITDVWYPETVRLRAEWRTAVTTDRERYAFDALRLTERALVLSPDRDLYLLRLLSAIALDDADLATESARYVLSYAEQDLYRAQQEDYVIPSSDVNSNIRNISGITNQLRENLGNGDADRGEAVLRTAERVLQQFQMYAAANGL
ncbi:MAG: fused MFS/spermidine synthase [Candidatus Rariloculaceae bacterium]